MSELLRVRVGRDRDTCLFVLSLFRSTFIAFKSKNMSCVIYAFCNLLILYLWLKVTQHFNVPWLLRKKRLSLFIGYGV